MGIQAICLFISLYTTITLLGVRASKIIKHGTEFKAILHRPPRFIFLQSWNSKSPSLKTRKGRKIWVP